MTDYISILSRAIGDKTTYDERRGVYERARQALVAQLRALDPPPSESEITQQRLKLEEAIRAVETDRTDRRITPIPAAAASLPAPPATPYTRPAPAQPLPATPPRPVAAPTMPRPGVPAPPMSVPPRAAPAMRQADAPRDIGPSPLERLTLALADGVDTLRAGFAALFGGWRKPSLPLLAVVAVCVVGALGMFTGWLMVRGGAPSSSDFPVTAAQKSTDRAGDSATKPGEPQSETAYLSEENVEAAKGADVFKGSVTWRVDTENKGQGPPERFIRGLVVIPERNLKLLLTLGRNTEKTLLASHTVELLFDVPQNFIHGAIESVAGLRMKPTEQANGIPLKSASARVTAGYFLLAMSALGADKDRNTLLLRERPWIDLVLLYRNGRRAVITMDKGASGEKIFNETFKVWGG